MVLCLLAVNLAPDVDKGTLRRDSRTISESSTNDSIISDGAEVADLRKAVWLLIVLGLAPFLVLLVANRWAPELLRIDITPASTDQNGNSP